MNFKIEVEIKGSQYLSKIDIENIKERYQSIADSNKLNKHEELLIKVGSLLEITQCKVILSSNWFKIVHVESNLDYETVNITDINAYEQLTKVESMVTEYIINRLRGGFVTYKDNSGIIKLNK